MKKRVDQEDDQDIIGELKKLPKVHDSRGKSAVYHQLSLTMENPSYRERQNRRRLLPILATLAVLVLIGFIPFMADRNPSEFSSGGEDSAVMHDTAGDAGGGIEASMEAENAEMNMLMSEPSNTIPAASGDFQIVYGAFADPQNQYVIPVSFLADPDGSLDDFYGELDQMIIVQGWDMADYLLAGASYSISAEEGTATLTLPEGFSLGQGSSTSYIFSRMLHFMFSPYGITKVSLLSEGDAKIDLGPIGDIGELQIDGEDKAAYKIYDNELLVPIPMEANSSIEEAIEEMKIDEPAFNVDSAVLEDMGIAIETDGEQITVGLPEAVYYSDEKDFSMLLEALLMTAKSYGYNQVTILDSPIVSVGEYDLTNPIPVPLAVNPVDIR